MRVKLTLSTTPNSLIPINYQGYINAWIYKTLSNAQPEFADWLHSKGFDATGKNYKLFTFSNFNLYPFTILRQEQAILLKGHQVELTLSFCFDDTLKNFVTGLFLNQAFQIGNRRHLAHFKITNVEVLSNPTFRTTMRYQALTPICISQSVQGRRHAQYLAPDAMHYEEYFINNLLNKYEAAQGKLPYLLPLPTDISLSMRCLKIGKRKGIIFKAGTRQQTKIIGYTYTFELMAPAELQVFGYFSGFGEKNSQGFGFCEVV